jgi:hypothetical protein
MKKKISITVALVICLGLVLGICIHYQYVKNSSGVVVTRAEKIQAYEVKDLKEYKISNTFGKDLGLNQPRCICNFDGNFIVSDSNNDRILVIDSDGNLLKTIGKTGNGDGEFRKPLGVTTDNNDNIYVADSGNGRVEEFNKYGAYIRTINIADFQMKNINYNIQDVEVDLNGNIYVSTFSFNLKFAHIYVISTDGKITKLGNNLCGWLYKNNNHIYFVSDFELIPSKKSIEAGRNLLIELAQDGFINAHELPYKTEPVGLCFKNDDYIVLSSSRATIDEYDSNLKYVGSPFAVNAREYGGICSMVMDDKENIYMLNKFTNVIYKLTRNN